MMVYIYKNVELQPKDVTKADVVIAHTSKDSRTGDYMHPFTGRVENKETQPCTRLRRTQPRAHATTHRHTPFFLFSLRTMLFPDLRERFLLLFRVYQKTIVKIEH